MSGISDEARPFAATARSLCTADHDNIWFCPMCRALEHRLTPISTVLKDVLAEEDLTVTVTLTPLLSLNQKEHQ